ncbi:SNF2 family protein [Streptococcus pyogenes]|nr:SNF2 family protein [Streptococcus pyogenes]VGQ73348.1 SNF2 family protein [Streptococcus pyogenes]VGR05117.1 SNF2 family protein [Streptococcus pyogenes]VGR10127.1 SNF2 family protein [Streptococcus pyogenes]VGU81955.1 SNF2 family protein [Streptococcus pyogenes]
MTLLIPYQTILQVIDNVERIYREGAGDKATQMIFSDIGTPKSKEEGFDVYNELKDLLVDRRIPKEQIAFVHDANTDEKKIPYHERSIVVKYGFSWLLRKKEGRV